MKWLWNASNTNKSAMNVLPGGAWGRTCSDSASCSKPTRLIRMFFLGALLYLAAVLPFIVYRGGIFFYYGDYNVQQVPFYILAHRAVRSGTLFWNFNIDLGSSTGGSYAFYLWGSPFFWISCLFSEKSLPYLLPVLMSFKYGTALCTSYSWLRRNVQTERGALMGALLYSFSGFAACNIVFQHFHEAIAFFPLYLLALDCAHEKFSSAFPASTGPNTASLGTSSRSSLGTSSKASSGASPVLFGILLFALATAGMSVVNYFFFFGQVIFLILYYILRYSLSQPARNTIKEILWFLLSGILGLSLAAFFLIQVWDTVSGNSRLSDVLTGYRLVAYNESTTPLAILKAMFFLPDLVGRGTLFTSDEIRVSSLSLYVPGCAMTGVIAFLRSRRGQKGDWKKRILLLCLVMMFIPVLNAVFSLFNSEYYARWFYMPLLVICLVTVQELEANDTKGLTSGFLVTFAADALILVCAFLPVDAADAAGDVSAGGLAALMPILKYPALFVVEAIITLVCLLLFLLILRVNQAAVVLTALCCVLTQVGVLFNGSTLISASGNTKWRSQLLESTPEIPGYNEASFQRVETDGTSTNYEMVWGYPTIHCFQSTVSPGIFQFYQGIGVRRSVTSQMNLSHIGARAILSARYYLENTQVSSDKSYDEQGGLLGYQRVGESSGYAIYENQNFIPMGFTFDRVMSEDTYSLLLDQDSTLADRMLVRDLILCNEDIETYGAYFEVQDTELNQDPITEEQFQLSCRERAESACTSFTTSNKGFTAKAFLDKENLVFFSVPYEKGWSAAIDGESTTIVKADYGLMAVLVPAGTHIITFTYVPYGWTIACGISLGALAVILALAILCKRIR